MKQHNCPNCGAPIASQSCEYCGTRLEDIFRMAFGKPATITLEINGTEFPVRFMLESMSMDYEPEIEYLYSDIYELDRPYYNVVKSRSRLTLEGSCLPFEDGEV